jgi:hypothetical protein
MTLEHAYILPEGKKETDKKDRIDCTFNPDKLTLIKTNRWQPQPAQGQSLPRLGFASGQPAMLKVTLVFDTTEYGGDVREQTDKLWKLMWPSAKHNAAHGSSGAAAKNAQKRPLKCTFVWGKILSFEAALTSLQLEYVLFLSHDGTPVRANAICQFTQIVDEKKFPRQNPTSGGITGEQIVRLGPRETLEQVAYEAFGNTSLWRGLAAFNGIDDPLRIRAGDELLLPPSAEDLKGFG